MNSASRSLLVVLPSLAILAAAQPGMLTVNQVGDYLGIADAPGLTPQAGITVEAWFFFDPAASGGASNPTIARKLATYLLRTDSGTGGNPQWILTTTAGSHNLTAGALTPLLTWTHLAGTYDNQVARLYMDGMLILESFAPTGPLSVNANELRIARGIGSQDTWKGSLDELRIWSVARTQAQIQSAMFQQLDGKPGLIAAWHFNGDYLDHTGGHHGTPVGLIATGPSTSPVLAGELRAPATAPIGSATVFEVVLSGHFTSYLMEMSLNGQSPGTPLPTPAGPLPLNPPLVYSSVGYLFPEIFVDFLGFTDPAGLAFPYLVVPPSPQIIGVTFDTAFVTLDAGAPGAVGMVSNAQATTITAEAPIILAVAPLTSPVSGNISLTISGTGFQTGAAVAVGGSPAGGVSVLDPQTITCTIPPGPLGPADVAVLNPDGNQGTVAGGLIYVEDMVITALDPVLAAPGQMVSVIGAGFLPGVQVSVGGNPVALTSSGPNLLQFIRPNSVPCDTAVVATSPNSQVATALLNPAPVITATYNAAGPTTGGGSFFILGDHFHPGTTVAVGGSPASVTTQTLNVILLTAPPGTPGLATVQVWSVLGCSATTSYLYQ